MVPLVIVIEYGCICDLLHLSKRSYFSFLSVMLARQGAWLVIQWGKALIADNDRLLKASVNTLT